MSSMQDTEMLTAASKYTERTDAALASIRQEKIDAEARSFAVIGAAMSYGEASLGEGVFGKLSRAMKWLTIWFAMVAPVYLFWRVALGG